MPGTYVLNVFISEIVNRLFSLGEHIGVKGLDAWERQIGHST